MSHYEKLFIRKINLFSPKSPPCFSEASRHWDFGPALQQCFLPVDTSSANLCVIITCCSLEMISCHYFTEMWAPLYSWNSDSVRKAHLKILHREQFSVESKYSAWNVFPKSTWCSKDAIQKKPLEDFVHIFQYFSKVLNLWIFLTAQFKTLPTFCSVDIESKCLIHHNTYIITTPKSRILIINNMQFIFYWFPLK